MNPKNWGVTEARQELSLPRVVYSIYEDVFLEELPKLLLSRAWVEVGYKAHRPRLWGPRGLSTPIHLKLSQQISQLFRACFYSRASGQEYCSILEHMQVIVCASVCEF